MRDRYEIWKEARRSARLPDSIFIWIPKNAGTSIYEMLKQHGLVKLKSATSVRRYFRGSGRVTFGHIDIGALIAEGMVSREFVDGAFKFAITRDPYARAVSLYSYLLKHELAHWPEPPDFLQLLRILVEGDYDRIGLFNSRGLSQCNPQVAWLRAAPPDKLYKVEELDEFVADLSMRWGVPSWDMPHLNRSASEQLNFAREEAELIERIYAEDFEELGYRRQRSIVSKAQVSRK
jgi:hypothetical protein